MSMFSVFGTGLRALSAYSLGIGVAANNIANANNENYSRQRVSYSNYSPDVFGGVEIGRGVLVESVSQVVSSAVELRLSDATQDLGQHEAQSAILQNVENILNEVGGEGLSQSMVEFFNSWSALANEPESLTMRQNVLNAADRVVSLFNQYGQTLTDLRKTIDSEISTTVDLINGKIQEIAEVNQKIRDSVAEEALTFKDERRKLYNELGSMIGVVGIENGDDLMVYTRDGKPLVSGITTATLSVSIDLANNNLYEVDYQLGTSGAVTNITADIDGGSLRGLLDARDNNIVSYLGQLDDLAYTFAGEVNTLHNSGFDLDGNAGGDFFLDFAGIVDGAALNLNIDAGVLGTPRALAVSADPNDVPGGNDVALDIAALYDSTAIAFQDGTDNSFVGFFGNLISEVGTDALGSENQVNFDEAVLSQVKLDRSKESGVNVDEEQVELIKLQAAYQAAGQMIKVADSILNTLFDALGFG